ncbi:MAG: hypothetical protein IKL41_07605, partial [Clostridia bacterium]|nr:hypothetical protein [Clostridia bacterium]
KEKRDEIRTLKKEQRIAEQQKVDSEFRKKQLASQERDAIKKQEQLQREKDEIEIERNRLLSLDDKGLKVEFILAMKGMYGKIESLEISLENLQDDISGMRSDISDLDDYIDDLNDRIDSIAGSISSEENNNYGDDY